MCHILDKFKKNSWQGDVRAGKAITLFILNDDIDDIIKIVGFLRKFTAIN